jgi:hypothetical protein
MMWTYLVLYSVKSKYWNDLCRENEILAYMVTSLMNLKVELVLRCPLMRNMIFGFKFGKLKVMRWPLSRKRDFSLYGYKFDKYECWPCPSISFDAKHDMWTYLVSYSVKWKYWNDPCRENEFLVYMPTSLINGKFELVPWCPWMQTWYVKLFGFVFGKMKVLEWLLSRKWDFGLYICLQVW